MEEKQQVKSPMYYELCKLALATGSSKVILEGRDSLAHLNQCIQDLNLEGGPELFNHDAVFYRLGSAKLPAALKLGIALANAPRCPEIMSLKTNPTIIKAIASLIVLRGQR